MAYPDEFKSNKWVSLGDFIHQITNLHMAIPLGFAMLFLWLNGTELWGAYWESSSAQAYLLMFVLAMVLVLSFNGETKKNLLTKLKFKDGVLHFWIGFLLMFAGLIVLSNYVLSIPPSKIVSSAVYPSIFLTAIFVAPVEETIFRGVLKETFKKLKLGPVPMGIIITSGLFAITHFAVYHQAIMSLWWAFVMGAVFYVMTSVKLGKSRPVLGVPGSIGAHTCYNLFVLGILSGGIV